MTVSADTYTHEYTPPYHDAVKWATALVPYVSGGRAGCNEYSGSIGIYASGWIGGGTASATQYVAFYVPTKSSIKAKVRIIYVGGTVNFGFASFSGTEWQWNLDNGSFHRHDISPPFSWDVVLGKIVDIALLALGSGIVKEGTTAAQVIELFDDINTVYGIASTLADLVESGDAEDMTKSFTFTADYGNHVLGVGIRGTATGVVTGSGFAIMGGYIPKVTLEITNDYSGSADLTIGDIDLSDNYPKRGQQIHFQVFMNNVGKGIADNDKVRFIIDEPGKPNAVNYITGDNYNFEPATTVVRNSYYTPATKGYLTFKAIADPQNEIVESDETNNEMDKSFYVMGLPPNKPSKPSGLPTSKTLIRNHTYTFTTSTTDPDGDAVKYTFLIQPEGATWGFIPGWDSESQGWNDGSVSFTPTVASGMGFAGTYYISAEALDSDGMYSGESDSEVFWIAANTAPSTPFITGPSGGYTVNTLSFSAYSTDNENDPVQYRFNWGDGTPVTAWTSSPTGHSTITVTHKYSTAGTYSFQVQAQDNYNAMSAWASQSEKITVYVPPPGDIEVISTIPAASFSIYKSGPLVFTGSGSYWDSTAAPGYYSIVFNSVDGYFTPPNESANLFSYGYISFNGCYAHKMGTIQVSTNNASASFTVTGSGTAFGQTFTGSGTSYTKDDAWVGELTITFGTIPGYCMPPENRTKQTLGNLETITFTGTYLLPPVADIDYYTTRPWVLEYEDAIEFNGSGSYNPNAGVGIAKYLFYFGDGTIPYYETQTFAPDGKFDGKTIHAYAQNGRYTPYLTVYDPYGNNTKIAASTITVKARPRARIDITPAPAICGETISFKGSGTDPDGDAIIAYEWRSDISGFLSTSASFTKDDLTTGSHVITLKVKDSDNLWSLDKRFYLVNYAPRQWEMFKKNPPRFSAQSPYGGRLYGLLPYGIKWIYPTGGPIIGSPVAANLDGNWKNGLEVAFASQDGNLYVLNNAGNFLWSKNIGLSVSTPAIDSLITTGSLCVVVGSSAGVYAFDNTGNQLWKFDSQPAGIAFESSPAIADINYNPHDGKETVIGCDDGNVYAIDSNGNMRWKINPPVPGAIFTSSPAIADVDPQRPGMETAIGSVNGSLYLLDANGNIITSWAPAAVAPIRTTPAIAQLVPNALATGGIETNIVFGADTGRVYCLWYTTGTLTLSWEYPAAAQPALPFIQSSPAIGVVGEYSSTGAEVIFGCDDGNVYDLKGSDGTFKTSFNCGGGAMVKSTPVIANIDTIHFLHPQKGDLPEVIFGATNGNLYAVSLAQGPQNLPWSPVVTLVPFSPILSSAAVCDLNHDPDMEILIGSTNNMLYMLAPLKSPALVPVAEFVADQMTGNAPLPVTFTDLSSNTPVQWYWDLGDECTTTTMHPTHTYDTPGTYTVCLTATNAHGCDTITKIDYIKVTSPPVTAFDCTPASGFASLQVYFTDQSRYNPTSWSWTFGDTGTSSQQNPSHTYNNPGTYTVSLNATNANGSNLLTKSDCVRVLAAPPVADFTQDVTDGKAPLSVNFTDLSTGSPSSWDWSFGDCDTSNAQNPSHSYTKPGNYLVILTATNTGGSDTMTNTILISVEPQTESVLIPEVPDIDQPPTKTLPITTQTNYSAPIAAENITEYWDYIIKDTNALAVDATLSSPTVAEYIGYFMDTNNDGSKDRGNGTDNHNGTFIKDSAIGLTEFVRWDASHPFDTPPATPPDLPPLKAGYAWEITTDYTVGWDFYKTEINAFRPALVNFTFWNPVSTGISVINTATGEEIDIYTWGSEISESQSANLSNPEEIWNLLTGEDCIGHTVTGVGYIENWDPDGPLPESNFAIVHDTWDTTPKHIAIPWENWNATIKVKAIKSQTSAESSWLLY